MYLINEIYPPGNDLVPINSPVQYFPETDQTNQAYRSEEIQFGKGYERWNARIVYLNMPIDNPVQQEYWVDQLVPLVDEMSDEDFRLRYGGAKPDNPSELCSHTRKVLGFEKTNHETLVVFQNGKVIAAASLFDPNQCELSSKGENPGAVEMSVTVATSHQGTGLARVLIEHTVSEAIALGNSHLYLSFVEGNDKSKQIFWHILGGKNIVAGRTNPLEMCFRLVGSFGEHEDLERHMVSKMGVGWFALPEYQATSHTPSDESCLTGRFSRAYVAATFTLNKMINIRR